MGRTQNPTKPKLPETIKLVPSIRGKRWCFLCKRHISELKGGWTKHLRERIHRENLEAVGTVRKELSEESLGDSDVRGELPNNTRLIETASDSEEEDVPHARWTKPANSFPDPPTPPMDYLDDTVDVEMETEGSGGVQEQEGNIIYIDGDPVSPLDPTKVYVHRHPYSRFGARSPSTPPSQSELPPKPSYWPYKTQEDFEFAELCLDAGLPTGTIDRLVRLTKKIKENPESFTLKNAEQVMEIADKATLFKEATFLERTVETEYKGHVSKHTLYSRDLDAAIQELLADPALTNDLAFDAERRYIARPDGSPMRVYSEYHHGNNMWDIQDKLGPSSKPILICAYADGTQISSHGNVSVWSVYIALANLPHHIRGSRGKGGYMLVGYIPKANLPPGLKGSECADFRNTVYQDCWRVILSSIKTAAQLGDVYFLGDGEKLRGTPIPAILPADYEEACRMNGNVGFLGPCGCVRCLVPSEQFHDTTTRWPERDSEVAARAISNILMPDGTLDDATPTPQALGIRPVKNAFHEVTRHYFALEKANGADGLHAFFSGEYGHHALPAVIKWMPDSQKVRLNKAFSDLPKYPKLPHFSKGITSLKWKSAADHKVIAIVLTPILDCVLPSNATQRQKVLRLFRLFGECSTLLRFTVHTDISAEKLQEVLNSMAVLQNTLQDQLNLNLNIPKHHVVHTHFVPSIRDNGPLCNTDTNYGEACHPQSKRDYKLTNMQTGKFEIQMLKRAARREAIAQIRDAVDAEAERQLELDSDAAPSILDGSDSSHVLLGSPTSRTNIYRLLSDLKIPQSLPQPDKAALFKNLQKLLAHFVPQLSAGTRGDASDVELLRATPCKLARIKYVSLEDHTDQTDLIRVTPDWRGDGHRYDFVLINLDHNALSCAQVHLLLTVETPAGTLQLSLIRMLKSLARNASTRFIHASTSSDYRFVSTECFVRSAFVHPPTLPNYPRYVINDLIDPDAYLRLEKQ